MSRTAGMYQTLCSSGSSRYSAGRNGARSCEARRPRIVWSLLMSVICPSRTSMWLGTWTTGASAAVTPPRASPTERPSRRTMRKNRSVVRAWSRARIASVRWSADRVGIGGSSGGDHDAWRAAVHGDFAEQDRTSVGGERDVPDGPGLDPEADRSDHLEERTVGFEAEHRAADGLVVHELQLVVARHHLGVARVPLERALGEERGGGGPRAPHVGGAG